MDKVIFGGLFGWFLLLLGVFLVQYSLWFFVLFPISLVWVMTIDYKYKVALFRKVRKKVQR